MRTLGRPLLCHLALFATLVFLGPVPNATAETTACDEACLNAALRSYGKAMNEAVESIIHFKAYRGDLDQAAGAAYLMAEIRGGETYRIWGTRGRHRRLDFQIHAGEPWSPKGGRVTATAASDDLQVAPDGSFEILVGPEKPAGFQGNWLSNPANYVSVQLIDVWMQSLEYANRQSMLNLDQAYRSADGAYYFVISRQDPGVQNWLDTVSTERGEILIRYDGMQGRAIPPQGFPTLQKIRLADLGKHLPDGTPKVSAEERA